MTAIADAIGSIFDGFGGGDDDPSVDAQDIESDQNARIAAENQRRQKQPGSNGFIHPENYGPAPNISAGPSTNGLGEQYAGGERYVVRFVPGAGYVWTAAEVIYWSFKGLGGKAPKGGTDDISIILPIQPPRTIESIGPLRNPGVLYDKFDRANSTPDVDSATELKMKFLSIQLLRILKPLFLLK